MKFSTLIKAKRETPGRRLINTPITFLLALLLMGVGHYSSGQISLTGGAYIQNFDGLPASGSATWTNNLTITGWYHARTGSGTTVVADDGTNTAGNLYSYGTGTATDRALGSIGSSNATAGSFFWGVRFQNNTGAPITSLYVSYTGEQWRNSAAVGQLISFSYLVGSPSVTGSLAEFQSAGVIVPSLNFTGPVSGGAAGALNGNLVANKTAVSFTITGLNVPNGTEIMLRWSDPDHGGNDHGLSIDDLTVSTTASITANLGDHLPGNLTVGHPQDVITYEDTIKNTSNSDALGITLNDPTPAGTNLNAGSVKTSALARDDSYSTPFNTALNAGNVLTNDFGLPSLTVVSFGTTANAAAHGAGTPGLSDNGGNVTVNANGIFTYTPASGFSGTDKFKYIATTGVAGLPNNDAVVTITVFADIAFSTTDVNPACNGGSTGSITFTGVTGGAGGYTYSITGANGTYQASNAFLNLPAGSYNLAVKDGNGYFKTGSTSLTDPAAITFPAPTVVNNVCNGGNTGSITINASGGIGTLTYSKDNGANYQASNVFNGLAGGTYNLKVKDANNCVASNTATLTDPAAVTFTFTKTDITCFGAANGSIVFNSASGGASPYTYSISGTGGPFTGSTSYTGLGQGGHSLVVKDNAGCNSAAVSSTVAEPVAIVVSGTIPQLTYNTVMTTVLFTKTNGVGTPANPWSATGLPTGVLINSANGNVTGTPTVTGSFSAVITYTDANGCTGTKSQTVLVGPKIVAETYTDVANTQLAGGIIPATPSVPVNPLGANDQSNATITYAVVTGPTHGVLTTLNSDGTFLYTPTAGNTTSDGFTYSGTSNGVSTQATTTINFSGKVWYVKAGGPVGDGRSNTPFNTLASAGSPTSGTGDFIYVLKEVSGTTPGAITLQTSQQLIGAGATLSVPTSGTILTLAGNAANHPTLAGTITLANSVKVDGIDMSTTTSAAISNGGTTVTGVNLTARNVTTTTGTGISITGTGNMVTMTLASLTTNGAANGLNLTNTTGSVTINGGVITAGSGAAFNISGGTVSLTYSGSASQSSGSQPLVYVSGGHATGTVTFQGSFLVAFSGSGLQFDNADGTYDFPTPITFNGGDAGIDVLNGSAGTFTFGNNASAIVNNTGPVINVTGSTANFTYSGAFAKSSGGSGINISNNTGGTININGVETTKALSTGANPAVSLSNNTGATINFTGGNIALSTSSGTGFSATGGGTINVTGTGNTISTAAGTALNVSSTTIGASGLTFQSIAANGGTNGIVLSSTGSGFLTVTGTGTTDGSGGTIQNTSNRGASFINTGSITLKNMNFTNAGNTNLVDPTTGGGGISPGEDANYNLNANAAIHLVNITGVTLDNLNISGGAQQGINGNNVTNFSLDNSVITGVGDQVREDGLHFKDMLGTSTISNTTFGGNSAALTNEAVQLHIENYTGAAGTQISLTNVNVQSTGLSAAPNGSHGFFLIANNTANVNFLIQNCVINNMFSNSIQGGNEGTGLYEISVTGCTFTNVGASAITLAQNNSGGLQFNIHHNGTAAVPTFLRGTNTGASASININQAGLTPAGAILEGVISNNHIGNNSSSTSANSGGDAMRILSVGSGTTTIRIDNNVTQGTGANGINCQMSEDVNPAHTMNLTIFNNSSTVTDINSFDGIRVVAGALSSGGGDQGLLRLDMHDNTGSSATANDFTVRQRFLTTVQLLGYGGANTDNAAVQTFLDVTKNNTPIHNVWFITNSVGLASPNGPGGGFVNTASVPQPTLPSPTN